jgi:TonB family protein
VNLRTTLFLILFIHVCSGLAPHLQATPALVAKLPEGTQKVIDFENTPDGMAMRLEDDSLVSLYRINLDLANVERPTLETGYSPAHYKVTRSKPDFFRDTDSSDNASRYSIDLTAVWDGERPNWAEIDLSAIWKPTDLSDPDSLLICAWWLPGKGWHGVLPFATNFKDEQIYRMSAIIPQNELSGRPHLVLFRKGRLVPPGPYRSSVKDSIIADLQNGKAPPGAEEMIEGARGLDPLDLSWIHYAAAWGREDWIQSWNRIEDKKRLRIRAKTVSPPALAAMHGHANVMDDLEEAGFSPADRDEFGYDACHFACIYGHINVVEAILDSGYNPNRDAADDIYRPLSLAYEFGYDDLFGLLLDRGGDFIQFNRSAKDSLMLTASAKGQANMLTYLVSRKADVNHTGPSDWRPLSLAIRSGSPEAVKVLLEAGADPDTLSPGGKPVLNDAIILGERDMIALLLEHGATTHPGESAPIGFVELATLVGQKDIVGDLMAAGVQCSMTPEVASDILVQAISSDIPEMAILAFDACVDPDFRFYDTYPVGWVIDYYGAESTRQWWESSGFSDGGPELEFVRPSDLDKTLTPVAGGLPEYDKSLFERFGKIETRVRIVIDDSGRVYFPKFEETLPKPLRLALYESILSWRFNPPTANGQPARAKAVIPVTLDRPQDRLDAEEVNPTMNPPELTKPVSPQYPVSLQNANVSGSVTLVLIIDPEGNVRDANAFRSSHPLLANACLKVAPAWEFNPATRNERPIASRVRITIPFKTR